MRKKTFKIGEYCIGGILCVEVRKGIVDIKALDWNTKEQVSRKVLSEDDRYGIDEYLNELTSGYYAGKVMDWIKEDKKVMQNG